MVSDPLANSLLLHRGGFKEKDLLEIFKHIDNFEEMLNSCSQSPYIDIENAGQYFTKFTDNFTVLDVNIQSLNAKFDIFIAFLEDLASNGFFSPPYVSKKHGYLQLLIMCICLKSPITI